MQTSFEALIKSDLADEEKMHDLFSQISLGEGNFSVDALEETASEESENDLYQYRVSWQGNTIYSQRNLVALLREYFWAIDLVNFVCNKEFSQTGAGKGSDRRGTNVEGGKKSVASLISKAVPPEMKPLLVREESQLLSYFSPRHSLATQSVAGYQMQNLLAEKHREEIGERLSSLEVDLQTAREQTQQKSLLLQEFILNPNTESMHHWAESLDKYLKEPMFLPIYKDILSLLQSLDKEDVLADEAWQLFTTYMRIVRLFKRWHSMEILHSMAPAPLESLFNAVQDLLNEYQSRNRQETKPAVEGHQSMVTKAREEILKYTEHNSFQELQDIIKENIFDTVEALEAEEALLQSALLSLQKPKKQPVFQPQNLQVLQKKIMDLKRRHAVFVDGGVKDGLLYASYVPKGEFKKHYTVSAEIHTCERNKFGLCSPDSFKNLYNAWFDLPYEKRAKVEGDLGFSAEKYQSGVLSEDALTLRVKKDFPDQELTVQMVEQALRNDERFWCISSQTYRRLFKAYAVFVHEALQTAPVQEYYRFQARDEHHTVLNGKVLAEQEAGLVKTMLEMGARIENNVLELPEYDSWAVVKTGQALVLEKDGVEIRYVPEHSSLPFCEADYVMHLDMKKAWPTLRSRVDKMIEQHGIPLNQVAVQCTEQDGDIQLQMACPVPIYNVSDDVRQAMKEAFEKNQPFRTPTGGKTLYPADYFSAEKRSQVMMGYREAGDYVLDDESALSDLHLLLEKPSEEKYSFASINKNPATALHEAEDTKMRLLAEYGLVDDLVEFEDAKASNLGQKAPLSERNHLAVSCQDIQAGIQAIKDLGLVESALETVPWEILHGDSAAVSAVHPDHYRSIPVSILSPGLSVLHGMTGCDFFDEEQSLQEAEKRLRKILCSGGLQSIATRRHSNNAVSSLSPLGDIASGLDGGVPTTVGPLPYHGEEVFFMMKPSILQRRDVWFAPRDFGGGSNRQAKYVSYAHSLGQESPWSPCPQVAKEKHIANVMSKAASEDNEAYFQDAIGLSEIDSIFANVLLKPSIEKICSEGLLPDHIHVEYFEGDDLDSRRGLAKLIARRRKSIL